MPGSNEPESRPDVDIDKGEGDTPAMNADGPKADADREVVPGNLGWDEPSTESPENLRDAVTMAEDAEAEPDAALPSQAAGAD